MSDPNPTAPSGPPTTPPSVSASPDEQSVRALLDIGRTLGILIALAAGILFLVALAVAAIGLLYGLVVGGLVGAGYCLIAFFVNYLIWREIPPIRALVDQRQYGLARDRLLLWTILGFLFFLVEGVVLLLAWIKVDELARGAAATGGFGLPPCPRCGGPLAWVPAYGRGYCYRCGAYA